MMVLFEDDAPNVLLVDDKAENIALLIDMLKPLNLNLFVALSAEEAYKRMEESEFNLILLGIVMPKVDGYEVCETLKNNIKYRDIPLIFISALSGVEDKIKGFSYGADDYITKPFIQEELLARVKLHLQKGMLFQSLKQLLRKSYHELYNPLAIINTSLEMQNIKYGSTKYTDAITVASRTLQVVYNDLYYSLSKDQKSEEIISINVKDFIQKRVNYFHYLKKTKNITIEFKSADNTQIQIREADLLRIVDNTLSNAIKYAYENSVVNIDLVDSSGYIIFKSKNSGSSINHPEKIFEKGYREDFEKIGMGIGLEIVASICHLYNIKAVVNSKNEVTSFKYYIPKIFHKV